MPESLFTDAPRYATIVADPPWPTKAGPQWWAARKPTTGNEENFDRRYAPESRALVYPTLSIEEIAALAPPAAKDAHLYLWTINKYVPAAYEVAKAWGFTPSSLLVWCKRPKGLGLGGTYVSSSEFILFCRRGSLPAKRRVDSNWWLWKRTSKHSEKPDDFYDLVEDVSPGPYLEMFARRERYGWDIWGNEVQSDVEIAV